MGAQMIGLPPTHTPAMQVSACVHLFPSLHAVPSVAVGFEHVPVFGSQTPASWHWSIAGQVLEAPLVQRPAWQVSPSVQGLPSSHAVPFSFGGLVHVPVA